MTEPSFSLDTCVVDGKSVAAEVIAEIQSIVEDAAIRPGLSVVLVGSDPASSVYVRNKSARAKECGFESRQIDLPGSTSESDLLAVIQELNDDESVHGILVQLPLPEQINPKRVLEAIDPRKDVDGFHFVNAGRLATGDLGAAFVPCTPLGIVVLLKRLIGENLSGKHAVIVGRSNIVGKPVAALLLAENCSVSVIHSKTESPEKICNQGDIVVAAVGVPRLVKREWVKRGAIVVDVGINRVEEGGRFRLVGDVDFEALVGHVSAITPVPGGVGPLTIAMLLRNTLLSALRQPRSI